MLTSVFYYNIYRPYIVGRVNERAGSYVPRRERITQSGETQGRVFVLNKALRNDIVNYAQSVSNGVTDLREATKRTAQNMENFNTMVHREGWEEARETLSEDLDRFAFYYNRSTAFMPHQQHSDNLRTYSGEVIENIHHGSTRLEMLGITLSEGQMSFDEEVVSAMNHEEINAAIGENIETFESIRSYTQQLMTEPLVDHMRFKALSYHYNYHLGTMETDGYSLIEAGMIVDRLV